MVGHRRDGFKARSRQRHCHRSDLQIGGAHGDHDLHLDGDQQRRQRDPERHGDGDHSNTYTDPDATAPTPTPTPTPTPRRLQRRPPWSGPTLYVSPAGSDSNPGTQDQPFRTIQKAANTVNPGNTVIVENGVYTYSGSNPCGRTVVCLTRGGESGRLVTFRSRNKWGAKLDGQNTRRRRFRLRRRQLRSHPGLRDLWRGQRRRQRERRRGARRRQIL